MSIRWDSENDWKDNQDSSGTTGRNGELKQGYSRDRPDLSNGLVGYWPLHDKNATDYSGNGNHGTLSGGITTGVAGKGGLQAMSFDGNDDYISIGSFNIGSSITATAWVNLDERKSNENHTIGPTVDNGNTQGFRIFTDSDTGEVGVWTRNDNSSVDNLLSSYLPQLNKWVFIAFTYDGSTGHLYANGDEIASGPMNANSFAGTGLISRYSGGGYNLNGQQAGVRLYNRPLTESEIQTLYEWGSGDYARPPQESEGGVSYWPLDGDFEDSWGNANGTATDVTFDSGIRGQSGKFNGSSSEISTNQISAFDWSQYSRLSFVTWVKPNSNPQPQDYAMVFDAGFGNGTFKGYSLEWRPGTPYGNVAAGEEIPVNQWTMLTMTVDDINGKAEIYYNTEKKAEISGTAGQLTDDRYFALGDNVDGGNNDTFDGLIDEARLYSKKLTRNQIFELYRYGTRGRDMRKQLVNH